MVGLHLTQQIGNPRFVAAIEDDGPLDMATRADRGRQHRLHRGREDVLHFGRHAGQADQGGDFALAGRQIHDQARGGAVGVEERFGPHREERHLAPGLVQVGAVAGADRGDVLVTFADHFKRGRVLVLLEFVGPGDGPKGHIIVGRPKAAGGDDQARPPAQRVAEGILDLVVFVAQDHHTADLGPERGDLADEPMRVGIKDLADQQFVADGEDLDGAIQGGGNGR